MTKDIHADIQWFKDHSWKWEHHGYSLDASRRDLKHLVENFPITSPNLPHGLAEMSTKLTALNHKIVENLTAGRDSFLAYSEALAATANGYLRQQAMADEEIKRLLEELNNR